MSSVWSSLVEETCLVLEISLGLRFVSPPASRYIYEAFQYDLTGRDFYLFLELEYIQYQQSPTNRIFLLQKCLKRINLLLVL